MDRKLGGLILIGFLITLSGCLEQNMYAETEFEEVNCTFSKINVDIQMINPGEVTIFTSKGQKSIFVREDFQYSYLIENDRKAERVLVTSGSDEFQTVVKLPQCACLLVDVRSEWVEPVLSLLVTGVEDSSVTINANEQEKKIDVKKGEIKRLNFTMKSGVSEILGEVIATGRCEQKFRYSIDLQQVVVSSGSVSYSIGEYVKVNKKLQMKGVTEGFALNVGENSGNITVFTDGAPSLQAVLQQNTLLVPGQFEELEVRYAIVPTISNGRLVFSDQVVSQTPATPVNVSVEFEEGYAPYYYDPYELTLQDDSPIKFSTQADRYTKLVNLAYGPEQVRITLVINATVTALGNTSARLEVLALTDTNLQKIETFGIDKEASSSYEKDGETYYVYEWTNLTEGDTEVLQLQTVVTRKAGLFASLKGSLAPVTQTASPYWETNQQMQKAADSLKGKDNYQTIYNVINHVKEKIDYEVNQERFGAIACYTSGKGACDEFADTTIAMLRYLGIPAVYVSGYIVQPTGESTPGSHAWVKVLDSQELEFDPQEMIGAIGLYRIEFYTEEGPEKSRYWLYGDVRLSEAPIQISVN